MISIIVPVYKAEKYLAKCIESILAQTYTDLEVLLIDDGSPDSSGAICDEFAQKDQRVKVFHVKNGGAASARNHGLDNMTGDYIGFVDNDDWIEPDMYEVMLKKAQETGADVVECGRLDEFPEKQVERHPITRTVSGGEAIKALIMGEIEDIIYNKLWKKEVFATERFMKGRQYEDVAIVYKLINRSTVTGVDKLFYHAAQRSQSVSHSHNATNLRDCWLSHKEWYDAVTEHEKIDAETERQMLRLCAVAIARTWAWYLPCYGQEREYIRQMRDFTREKYPVFCFSGWPMFLRVGMFFARFDNKLSFIISYAINKINRWLRPRNLY